MSMHASPVAIQSSERIELVIIEDKINILNAYVREFKHTDDINDKIIGNIQAYSTAEDFFSKGGIPSPNKVYIVDLILRDNDIELGSREGISVLKHITLGENNPVFVRSANLLRQQFAPVFIAHPEIRKFDKGPGNDELVFYEAVYEAIRNHFDWLNRNAEITLSVNDCLDSNGDSLSEESIPYEIFERMLFDKADPGTALFITKCFFTSFMPPGETNLGEEEFKTWDARGITWLISAGDDPGQWHGKEWLRLKKQYALNTGLVSAITLENKDTTIEINNLADIEHILPVLEDPNLDELDKWIIRYFAIKRCVDLFLYNNCTAQDIITAYRKWNIFGPFRLRFERAFIFMLWEKLMLGTGGNRNLVQLWLYNFYRNQFPEVNDVFYCQVTELENDEAGYIPAYVRSLENPAHTVPVEYKKEMLRAVEPLLSFKPFKITFYHKHDTHDENINLVECMLPEEWETV